MTITGVTAGARVLEIGCATGKATRPLATRGLHVTALEPGPALAFRARASLAGHKVHVVNSTFEQWQGSEPFALVVAATSWHWIDPAVRYAKAASHLQPGGHLAFWSAVHVIPRDGDALFEELQPVYDEIGEGMPGQWVSPRPGELPDESAEIVASGLFDVVDVRQFDWEIEYDADGYIDLLNTFSGHIAMEEWQRERLYGEIRSRLAVRPDGRLRRHWGAILHVARRVD